MGLIVFGAWHCPKIDLILPAQTQTLLGVGGDSWNLSLRNLVKFYIALCPSGVRVINKAYDSWKNLKMKLFKFEYDDEKLVQQFLLIFL